MVGASDWRSVLRCIALMLHLPEFLDGNGPKCFDDIGNNCIMDVRAWGTCPRVQAPTCSLEAFAQILLTRQECLDSYVPSGTVAQLRGCAWMCCCAEIECSPGEMACAEDWDYSPCVTNWGKPSLGWRLARPTTAYQVSQRIDTIR